ncbi:hypothetical protein L3X38_031851 [Prunus dulcis]|uniref:DUF4218 domain-containing protein n=1 Tax=Prunus dulcis TaxID=3755 RepID=A0AAD4YVH7_PRUDU|nr:hypothetical protein L3X38_031851 [Prunus dulcis]
MFTLRAAVMWTVNDFSAYAMVSGWSTKGYMACPVCKEDISRARQKDTIKARLDLERMGIRRGLWMNRDSDKVRRDLAFFSMKPNDKKEFLKFVSSVKFPDGYTSNIARCLRHDIVQVLCKFEMIFPPAFFTSMMHVMVHLPE